VIEAAALVGQIVDGRWLLVEHIGQGRFGDVYSAEPRHLDLGIGAVKVIRPGTERERRQVLREIQALAALSHDNLVSYRDAGEVTSGLLAGGIYVVTELCDGTLADEPSWGTGDLDAQYTLARVLQQVSDALRYLHSRGIVHRDVKPANILRSGDRWKLADFGLVHHESDPAIGAVQGTTPYLAPETIERDGTGPPADIYALGVVVHRALTGTWPYEPGDGPWSGPPIHEGATVRLSPRLPIGWRLLVQVCMNSDPALRPTAGEIPGLVPDQVSSPRSRSPRPTPSATSDVTTLRPRRRPRGRAVVVVSVVALVAILAITTILVLNLS
jgi:serine/threonine protein kinase